MTTYEQEYTICSDNWSYFVSFFEPKYYRFLRGTQETIWRSFRSKKIKFFTVTIIADLHHRYTFTYKGDTVKFTKNYTSKSAPNLIDAFHKTSLLPIKSDKSITDIPPLQL